MIICILDIMLFITQCIYSVVLIYIVLTATTINITNKNLNHGQKYYTGLNYYYSMYTNFGQSILFTIDIHKDVTQC